MNAVSWVTFTIILSFIILCSAEKRGMSAPNIPEEYYCNVIQRKWNHNGFGVNHTESATSYSSYSQQYYRFDSASIEAPNSTNPQTSTISLSLNDYTTKLYPTPIDTFVEMNNAGQVPSCSIYNSTWPPPLPSNALQLLNAIYAGKRVIAYFGRVDEWTVLHNSAVATFWFSESTSQIVGYQFETYDASQAEVGVVTYMFNLIEGEVPSSVFAGSGGFEGCVNKLQTTDAPQSFDTQYSKTGVVPLQGFKTWVEKVRKI